MTRRASSNSTPCACAWARWPPIADKTKPATRTEGIAPMTTHILTNITDNVMTVRFNRPDKKNPVTMEMYAALASACRTAETDPKVRVVVFGANGDVFCAGNDMKDFLTQSLSDSDLPVYHFMRALSSLRKPVIAAVNGAAIGIGATLLLHCDFVYATPSA